MTGVFAATREAGEGADVFDGTFAGKFDDTGAGCESGGGGSAVELIGLVAGFCCTEPVISPEGRPPLDAAVVSLRRLISALQPATPSAIAATRARWEHESERDSPVTQRIGLLTHSRVDANRLNRVGVNKTLSSKIGAYTRYTLPNL